MSAKAMTFDIRNYTDERTGKKKNLQRDYDRFNLYMVLIEDITFKVLLTSKVSELYSIFERKLLSQPKSSLLKPGTMSALQKAGKELVKVSKDKTVAEIFATKQKENRRLASAVKKIRRLGIFLPSLLEVDDDRQQYFRKLVANRVVYVIGDLTPRNLFEGNRKDLSALQQSVILEAKLVGLFASSSCGDPAPGPNDMVCKAIGDETVGQCIYEKGSHCLRDYHTGMCTPGADLPTDDQPPEYEPTPGGSDNP